MREALLGIVCRTVNRLLVGLPLCKYHPYSTAALILLSIGRDPDYRSLNEQFTIDLVVSGSIINMFPISFRQ